MKLAIVFLLVSLAVCFKRPGRPNIFMIPHGEKMTNGSDRLSEDGLARAECLREIFGPGSVFNIGFIIVPKYKFTLAGIVDRLGFDTMTPLAEDLNIDIRAGCARMVYGCVLEAIDYWVGTGKNALVCWEPKLMGGLSRLLGLRYLERYPSGRHDIIWELTPNRYYMQRRTLQKCPGLDVPWRMRTWARISRARKKN
ncbi:unnamed protein product [Clonostachys byssicola]|uniref:Phosphoglycerate mutase family protein n=1 Tax=Clonostachys byssicola TaxID=160290 RepID=A0A9N9U9A3_9HYPO|nr:unnamed protein product [Clonostachys byssicola]